MSIDNFTKPALWSATEVAIAIFSCSIPSLTYLFRQVAGSTSSDSNKQLKIQPGYRKNGTVYQRGDDVRQDRRFQRLRDDFNHVDNVGLNSMHAATVKHSSEIDLGSYGHNQIAIRNDYDVECDRSAGV